MKDKSEAQKVAGDELLRATGQYLKEIGWMALVASVDRIQQQPGNPAYNYELVIRFTGGRREAAGAGEGTEGVPSSA